MAFSKWVVVACVVAAVAGGLVAYLLPHRDAQVTRTGPLEKFPWINTPPASWEDGIAQIPDATKHRLYSWDSVQQLNFLAQHGDDLARLMASPKISDYAKAELVALLNSVTTTVLQAPPDNKLQIARPADPELERLCSAAVKAHQWMYGHQIGIDPFLAAQSLQFAAQIGHLRGVKNARDYLRNHGWDLPQETVDFMMSVH